MPRQTITNHALRSQAPGLPTKAGQLRLGILATHVLLDAVLHDQELVEKPSVRRAIADVED